LQVDEIWCYVGKKRRNVRSDDSPELGDQWVYVAIDAETKLVPSVRIGKRVRPDTWAFLWDLHKRLANRVQLTTDGLNHYTSVPECFGTDVGFRSSDENVWRLRTVFSRREVLPITN
jgi:IS1 family transposase